MNIKKNNKLGAFCVLVVTAMSIGSASAALDPSGFVTEITGAVAGVETVLTAGLAIIGGFFLWRVLKRALNRSV